MPHTVPRIFISCVTAEFGEYRVEIAKDFRAADCDVKIQEDFRQVPEDTIQKLDAYIRNCAAVIHIVGEGSGATAGLRIPARRMSAIAIPPPLRFLLEP